MEYSLRANFIHSLGALINKKIENIELDLYAILDVLIDMSTAQLYDPSLKINRVPYQDLVTKTRMYLPSLMPECKEEIITNLNVSGILKDFSVTNMANNDEGFLKEMLNILENRSSPLMQLELQKTYLVVLQWYKSTTRRIQDLQTSLVWTL